jgi:hypothetical protein
MTNSRTLIILFAVLVLGSYGAFQVWNTNYFKNLIPSEIGISHTVFIDGKSGGLEGCGVAIFRMDSATLNNIRANGSHALDGAKLSRKKKFLKNEYQGYTSWKETPYMETGDGMTLADRWLGGFVCASIDSDLSKSIHNALRSAKSYYATTHEAGLIVIPRLGLVVYSYFG